MNFYNDIIKNFIYFKYKIRSLTYGIWLYMKTNIHKTKIV